MGQSGEARQLAEQLTQFSKQDSFLSFFTATSGWPFFVRNLRKAFFCQGSDNKRLSLP